MAAPYQKEISSSSGAFLRANDDGTVTINGHGVTITGDNWGPGYVHTSASFAYTTASGAGSNSPGGTHTLSLGTGAGSGSPGYQTITSTVVGANTVPALNPYPVWPALGVQLKFNSLTQDFDSTTANGIKALAVYATTDNSSHNYINKYGAGYDKFNIQMGGGTIDHAETWSSVCQVDASATGTITAGYGISGEFINASAMTIGDFEGVFASIQQQGSGNATSLESFAGSWTLSGTGTIGGGAVFQGGLTVSAAGTVTNGYGLQVTTPSITNGGVIVDYRAISINGASNTPSHSSTTAYDNYGIRIVGGNQGGNTSGTGHNYAAYIIMGSGVPGGGGSQFNTGIRLTGNGGAGATNWAIYGDSTANYAFAGAVALGSTSTPTASSLTMADAWNVVVGTTTGTQIGTGATQKLGFYGAAPVVQPAASADTHTVAAGSTTSVFTTTTFDGSVGSSAYTVGGIVKQLKALGLLAA